MRSGVGSLFTNCQPGMWRHSLCPEQVPYLLNITELKAQSGISEQNCSEKGET